jgi:bifunctional DNA-binding transcriptional regulator/antitoxin component of YhaV-PrlF toxin-antitoxin module
MFLMKIARISKGGQVSIPAAVKNRWGADQVLIEDRGDALVLRPLPADPIGAALDLLPADGPAADEIRAQLREEEAAAEARRRVAP